MMHKVSTWKVLFIYLFIFFPLVLTAQNKTKRLAEKAFDEERYFDAADLLLKLLDQTTREEDQADIQYKIARCYHQMLNPAQAETWYKKARETNSKEPLLTLYLADVLKAQGRYSEATAEYIKYVGNYPDDPRGQRGSQSCELAEKWKANPTRYEVIPAEGINSVAMDFCPTFADKKYTQIVFTSTREGATGNKQDGKLGQKTSDLYESKRDKKGKWSTPALLNEEVNSQDSEGAASVNRKSGKIYFTRCPFEKGKDMYCYIYSAQGKSGKYSETTIMQLASDTINCAHPAISADETLLIFTSNLHGGIGGYDLWYCTLDPKAKTWSTPANMGSNINTEGDEKYPYIHDDGTLYFSSNGHLGMGGLDIFKAIKKGPNSWESVENLKSPINSPQDDFGIIYEGKKDKGLLTSNREASSGDDIFSFSLPPLIFILQGTVTDLEEKIPIANATVRLAGSDSSIVEIKTDNIGFYQFAENKDSRYILPDVSYKITVSAPDFLNGKGNESTKTFNKSTTIIKDFALQPTRKKGKVAEINFPEVLYDLGQFTLKPESKDSLDFLYKLLLDNPSAIIELSAHTDSRGSDEQNKQLSEERAKACVDYLISKGIATERLKPVGYGENRLKITDAEISKLKTPEEKDIAHQKNRRTVFSVITWDASKDAALIKERAPVEEESE